jgi:hypothetical protein
MQFFLWIDWAEFISYDFHLKGDNKNRTSKFKLFYFTSNFNAAILQNDHLSYWLLMDHKKKFCYFISKKVKNFAYLESIFNTWISKTRQMSWKKWVHHISVSNLLLCPVIYCVKQSTMSTVAFNMHLFCFPLFSCCGRIMVHSV